MPEPIQINTATVKDILDRPIREGDEVILMGPGQAFRVLTLTRVVDPKLPPNLVKVELAARFTVMAPAGETLSGVVRGRSREELGLVRGQGETPAPPPELPAA